VRDFFLPQPPFHFFLAHFVSYLVSGAAPHKEVKQKFNMKFNTMLLVALVVTAHAASCKTEPDTDFYGGDIGGPGHPHRKVGNLADCCKLCGNTATCKFFSYSGDNGGTCWLKSSFVKRVQTDGRTAGSIGDLPPPPPAPGPPPKPAHDACFPTPTAKWCNYTLSIPERVDALIAALTLDDKIQQISTFTPKTVPGVSRIGLPPFSYHSEGLHGLRNADVVGKTCTIFPQTTGMAANGNLSMIRSMGEVMGAEARALDNIREAQTPKPIFGRGAGLFYWSPTMNLGTEIPS
jgi:hypothetical protein